MLDVIFLQQGDGTKNLFVCSLSGCVDPDRVVAFRENIQGDSDEKPVFGKKLAPVIIRWSEGYSLYGYFVFFPQYTVPDSGKKEVPQASVHRPEMTVLDSPHHQDL